MVFIHGGGFVIGSKDAPVHDGSAFARSGVVCVAINYRLGIDGFLPIPGVPTNLGLRDMLFALQWVQRQYRGVRRRSRPTSPSSASPRARWRSPISSTSPLAKGLFKRAIVESGHGAMVRDIAVAQRLVRKLAKILKCHADADGFRNGRLRAAAGRRWRRSRSRYRRRSARRRGPRAGLRHQPLHPGLRRRRASGKAGRRARQGCGQGHRVADRHQCRGDEPLLRPDEDARKVAGFPAALAARRSRHPKAREALAAYGLGQRAKAGHVVDRSDERSRVPLARAALCRGASGPDARLRFRLALAGLRRRARRLSRHRAAVRVQDA